VEIILTKVMRCRTVLFHYSHWNIWSCVLKMAVGMYFKRHNWKSVGQHLSYSINIAVHVLYSHLLFILSFICSFIIRFIMHVKSFTVTVKESQVRESHVSLPESTFILCLKCNNASEHNMRSVNQNVQYSAATDTIIQEYKKNRHRLHAYLKVRLTVKC